MTIVKIPLPILFDESKTDEIAKMVEFMYILCIEYVQNIEPKYVQQQIYT